MFVSYQAGNLHCVGVVSMQPTLRKLLRTGIFLVALGLVTSYAIQENASWQLLVPYIIGIMVLFGVEGFEVSYGDFTFRFPIEVEDDSSDSESE